MELLRAAKTVSNTRSYFLFLFLSVSVTQLPSTPSPISTHSFACLTILLLKLLKPYCPQQLVFLYILYIPVLLSGAPSPLLPLTGGCQCQGTGAQCLGGQTPDSRVPPFASVLPRQLHPSALLPPRLCQVILPLLVGRPLPPPITPLVAVPRPEYTQTRASITTNPVYRATTTNQRRPLLGGRMNIPTAP